MQFSSLAKQGNLTPNDEFDKEKNSYIDKN